MNVKKRIINAGKKLLPQMGYKAVTTDMIAKRARVSKATLYENFSSKDELMEAICISIVEENMARVDELFESGSSPLERIIKLLDYVTEFLPRMQYQVLNQIEQFDPSLWGKIESFRSERIKTIKKLVTEAQQNGYIRDDLDPELWLKLLQETIQSLINPKTLLKEQISLKKLLPTMRMLYLEGILTEKGRRRLQETKMS